MRLISNRIAICLLGVSLLTPAASAQLASPPIDEESVQNAIERFRALPLPKRLAIVRKVERAIDALEMPAADRMRAILAQASASEESWPSDEDLGPEGPNRRRDSMLLHDPVTEVPDQAESGLAPPRRALAENDKRLTAAFEQFTPRRFLPRLHRAVHYDWFEGTPLRGGSPSRDQRFENALRGAHPKADLALALVLDRIDTREGSMDAEIRWFEHTYCDREGNAFPGITLFDAWTTTATCEVPDVDSFNYLRTVLAGKGSRDYGKLYPLLSEAAQRQRRYRDHRHALAAALICPAVVDDPLIRQLIPRLQVLLEENEDDVVDAIRALDEEGRDGLIARVDSAIIESPSGAMFRLRDGRIREMREYARAIAQIALDALDAAG